MASLAKEPFNHRDWIFENKLDGYRAIAVIDSTGKARIWSRNRLPLEQKFPTVRDAAEELHLRSTILDGEIVALDEEGIPRFQLVQKWQKRPTAPELERDRSETFLYYLWRRTEVERSFDTEGEALKPFRGTVEILISHRRLARPYIPAR